MVSDFIKLASKSEKFERVLAISSSVGELHDDARVKQQTPQTKTFSIGYFLSITAFKTAVYELDQQYR